MMDQEEGEDTDQSPKLIWKLFSAEQSRCSHLDQEGCLCPKMATAVFPILATPHQEAMSLPLPVNPKATLQYLHKWKVAGDFPGWSSA